ncbi:NnrU family protein [Pacificoceanicola onchidii]|uniref:NnrU family protein n=1 Tax=Pacificoceanicola onchidii TaxID=2562685 RepID=UPI0010A5A90B|nr:NnrU family protein [Pacificoceanicola onchidii]
MDWAGFIVAFIAFFVTHSVPVRPPVRPYLVQKLGAAGFGAAYSLLSLGVLTWLIVAARNAPFVPLWDWSSWQVHLALTLMLIACLLAAMAIARPNPFSFGGARNDTFDPQKPGVIRLTRHPLLLALAVWSVAHVLTNGDLAHVILFGTFAAFSLLGGRLVDRRRKREIGAKWHRLWRDVQTQPLRRAIAFGELWRLVAGIALYLLLLLGHGPVIGISPLQSL